MQYEPIKRSVGRFFSGSVFGRKLMYFFLDLLLLRTWHVKRAVRNITNKLPPDACILDAGSGMGQYSWWLSKLKPAWRIKGVDINQNETDDCNRFFNTAGLSGRVGFSCEDLTLFSESDAFNLVLSVDVMEHIADDDKVFRNFYSSMRDDGILIISTPSDQGGSDVHDDDDEPFIGEHVRNGYGREEIAEKLKKAGFSRAEASYTYGKPGSLSWRLSMKYPIKLLNISKAFFLVLPFYYILVLPVSMILNYLDVCLTHKKGTGLLVFAFKDKR
ncbi:MAG TPA: class I SAM-dependent methyltransferase [Bacteroidales bacterium]|nr:class I SAM-dependent methyltransferase [Bacteroidales bacterium]HPR11860.1 class I SAM-dependent methyltransferase [Bacteroidales bacterium]HRW83991.1 class I SAM-dependent methyltransferase [Bacteroidales bacterium]